MQKIYFSFQSYKSSQSFFPDKKIVVYVTGVRQWWNKGEGHEIALEFNSPKIPKIIKTTPEDKGRNVPQKTNIVLNTDAPLGDFVNWEFEITPTVNFTAKYDNSGKKITLELAEDLIQDGEYVVKAFRTPRSYEVKNDKDVEVGETQDAANFTFATVTTPLIKSYSPKGNGAIASKPLTVVFAEEMDKTSVESGFSISPATEGTKSWTNEKTLVFTPTGGFKKDTSYTVTFAQGLISKFGGTTDKSIVLKFKTLGRVAVSSISPVSGSYGKDPNTTNITVTFNQEVDHASAQAHFSISPKVSGTFGWSGNSLIYYTAKKLGYSTKYSIRLSSGIKTVYGLDSNKTYGYTFTTKDNLFLLPVPYYGQQETFSCNLAATRMALAFKGVYVSESTIRNWIGIGQNPNADWVSHYGVHSGPIASFISRYRRTSVKHGWDVVSLAREVEAGHPVILWWYNRYSRPATTFSLPGGYTGYRGMHSEVVRGFKGSSSNPTGFYTNDPWRGHLYYSRSSFVSNWAYMGYTAVVVY